MRRLCAAAALSLEEHLLGCIDDGASSGDEADAAPEAGAAALAYGRFPNVRQPPIPDRTAALPQPASFAAGLVVGS